LAVRIDATGKCSKTGGIKQRTKWLTIYLGGLKMFINIERNAGGLCYGWLVLISKPTGELIRVFKICKTLAEARQVKKRLLGEGYAGNFAYKKD
jgi:hypothetical protein